MARGPFAEKSRNGRERRKELRRRDPSVTLRRVDRERERERERDMAQKSKQDLHLPVIALILAASIAATLASTVALDPEEPEWNFISGTGTVIRSTLNGNFFHLPCQISFCSGTGYPLHFN